MFGARAVILNPQSATPRATCIVDLISKVMRPWLFRVTVTGEPPHAFTRVYPIAAPDGEKPARSALVESPHSNNTPSEPSSASLATSAGCPSTGVWSNL